MPRLNWAWTCTSSQTWSFQKLKIKIKNKTRFGEGLNWTPSSLYPDIGIEPHKPMTFTKLSKFASSLGKFKFCQWWKIPSSTIVNLAFCQSLPLLPFLLQIVVDAQDNFSGNDNNHENKEVSTPHTHPYLIVVNETQLEFEKLLVMACPPCSLATITIMAML